MIDLLIVVGLYLWIWRILVRSLYSVDLLDIGVLWVCSAFSIAG
jgi:hypothetical protein